MDAIFGMEFPLLIKFVVSFAVVLALIGIAALLFKRFGAKGLKSAASRRGRQPRLAVVDTAPVDSRRSLVIVRRDNVEHLLLIGGPTDLLVEPNISQVAAHVGREPEPVVRPVTSDLPPPNWAPANTSWPVAAQADTSPLAEPARKPEPRPDARPEQVARSEPVFLPEPTQRPDPDVRIQQVPAFEPAPASAGVRSVPAQADFSLSPQDHPLPAYAAPASARAAARPVEDIPPAPVAQDLDAPREKLNGTVASHHVPAESPPPRQAMAAPPTPVRRVEAAFNEDQNLADMAQRLEAALRRPLGANGAAAPPQAALRPVAQASPSADIHRHAPATAAVAAPAVSAVAAAPAGRSEAQTYENLQREMASLLGRKPGSS